MKLITTLMLLMILNFSAISQQVINFGVSDQITMCSDGYIDDAGNSIVLMYNEVSGFMIGSFDPYFNTNWITSFGCELNIT